MSTKNIELKLKSVDIKSFSTFDFLKFSFNRKSFFRDYQNLRSKSVEEVRERVSIVIEYVGAYNLFKEVSLCFYAAIQSEKRHTYYFNVYLLELVELYYSEAIFISQAEEIREEHLVDDTPTPISYEWMLFSKILSPYQRYLLFEYLSLGYSIAELAARRYCDTRTIYNHFDSILEDLSF